MIFAKILVIYYFLDTVDNNYVFPLLTMTINTTLVYLYSTNSIEIQNFLFKSIVTFNKIIILKQQDTPNLNNFSLKFLTHAASLVLLTLAFKRTIPCQIWCGFFATYPALFIYSYICVYSSIK